MTKVRGFTLIELLTALLILSLLALMSYRGLGAVLDTRQQVGAESEKWQRLSKFFARFEADLRLAAPRTYRSGAAGASTTPAWRGRPGAGADSGASPRLEFGRFAAAAGEGPRRVGYQLNDKQEVEFWLWPGLDLGADVEAKRYPVLSGVSEFQLQYLNNELAWVDSWPAAGQGPPLPRAVRVRILLVSKEEIVRIFALNL